MNSIWNGTPGKIVCMDGVKLTEIFSWVALTILHQILLKVIKIWADYDTGKEPKKDM